MVRDIGRKFKWKFYFSPILFFWKLFLLELFEEWTWRKPHTVFQLLLKRKARAASSRRASPSVHNQAPLPGFGMTFHWASSHKTSCESAGKPKHPVGLLGSSSLPLSDSQLESICASAVEARGWTQNEPRRTDPETGEAQSPAERSQQRLRAGWVWREGKRQGSIRARSEVRGRRPDATHAPQGKGGRAPAQITDKQWNLAAGGVVYHWIKEKRRKQTKHPSDTSLERRRNQVMASESSLWKSRRKFKMQITWGKYYTCFSLPLEIHIGLRFVASWQCHTFWKTRCSDLR